MKNKIAIIRGAFLNKYEMQFYEPLNQAYDITAFGSKKPFHDQFVFPTKKLVSPMDLPDFPKKMAIINRIFIDAHYLYGLEKNLRGYDIVHTAETYYHFTQQAIRAKQKGYVKKVIATVLENIPFNNEGIRGRKEFKKNARNNLDYIIALTERTKIALILEGADESKISILPHFIDTNRFKPNTEKLHKKNNEIEILYCGRLESYKGIFELLYASYLLKHDPELRGYIIKCRFVGNGSEKYNLLNKVERLKIKDLISIENSSYEEMPNIYSSADIYCAPSKNTGTWIEQYNTTLLEAQASGLAIVSTYSGGIPENVGDAALLVSPGDVLSLFQSLKKFILNKKQRLEYGEKARKRAQNTHDIKIGASKLADIYESLLSN